MPGQPRLADHRIRPTIVLLTSRRAQPSPGGVFGVLVAVAGSLACAAMLQYIVGAR